MICDPCNCEQSLRLQAEVDVLREKNRKLKSLIDRIMEDRQRENQAAKSAQEKKS